MHAHMPVACTYQPVPHKALDVSQVQLNGLSGDCLQSTGATDQAWVRGR